MNTYTTPRVLAILMLLLAWPGSQGLSSEYEEYRKAQQESMEAFARDQGQAFENFYREQQKAFDAFSQSEDGVVNRTRPYQEKDILPAKPLVISSRPVPPPSPPAWPEPRDEEPGAPPHDDRVSEEKPDADIAQEPIPPEHEAPMPEETRACIAESVDVSEVVGDDLRLNYFGAAILFPDIGRAKLDASFGELDPSGIVGEAKRRNAFLVPELRRIRDERELNDWDTVVLVRRLMNILYDSSQLKIKTVQAIDLLRTLGYRCRLGRVEQTPVVLLAVEQELFYKSFLTEEERRYYIFQMDRHARMNPEGLVYLSTSPEDSVGAPVDMSIKKVQRIGVRDQHRTLTWDFGDKEHSIAVRYNDLLLDLMDEYPQVDLSVYFQAGTHRGPSMDLMRQIRALLDRELLTEEEQVNFLLRFVQKAFEYKTDQDAYGYERPLFVEQSLGLPYLDCEDRSVLLSTLYRNILGWDTVGLDYPMHVSLGVDVPFSMEGDAYEYRSRRYIVADPSYLYADAGESQPKYKNASAEVIETE